MENWEKMRQEISEYAARKYLWGGMDVRVSDALCKRQKPVKLPWWRVVWNFLRGSRERYKWVWEEIGVRVGNTLYVSQEMMEQFKTLKEGDILGQDQGDRR